MPVNPIESNVGDIWQAKQTALGTIEPAAASGTKHLRKATDDALKPAQTTGSEDWTDGQSFTSASQFIDTVGGDVGQFTFQAQPDTAGFAFAQVIGVDVVTGTTPDFTHTIASGNANGPYQTIRQKTGSAIVARLAFYDAKVSKLTWNVGKDQTIAHITEGIMAINAAEWYTTDPTAADSGNEPFNWNQGAGSLTVDAVNLPEVDGETLEIDRNLDVHRGESAKPVCFVPGRGAINRTFSAIVTDGTLPYIKKALFGTTTPTDGMGLSTVPTYVALETNYVVSSVRGLKISTPKVQMSAADFDVGARTGGGKIPVAFGGQAIKGASPIITIVAKTGDSASYV